MLVFLLSTSVLSLEVELTRVFSFIMFHHFTYLVLSVAMLGFGVAGTYLTIRKTEDRPSWDGQFLAGMATMFGFTTIVAIVLIPRIHFYPLDMYYYNDYSNLLSLLVIIALAALPFFFGGACVAYVIISSATDINYIYFADLTGAATGCLLVLLLVNTIGAIAACFISASIALFVACVATKRRRTLYIVAIFAVVVCGFAVAGSDLLPLYVPRHKQMFGKEHLVESVKWDLIARLDVTQPVEVYYSFGGALSRKYTGQPQTARIIYQDGTALTGVIQPTPTPSETPSLGYYLQGAAYRIRPKADVLAIGCGGGPDIVIALYHGASRVVGVDINPEMIALMHEYNDFANHVFTRPDVELIAAEGRHFLSRDPRKFDVIQLSGVDTSAAQASGEYALSENFIYTVEACTQYLDHLKEGGIVNFSRPPGWQTLKIVAMWMEALDQHHAEAPQKQVMILKGNGLHRMKVGDSWIVEEGPWSQTLVKISPFTPEEVRTLIRWTEELGFEVVYDPYTQRDSWEEKLIRADREQRQKLTDEYSYDIRPCSDDRPYYFQFYRWEQLLPANLMKKGGTRPPTALLVLLGSLVIVSVLSGFLIIYPLRRRGLVARSGGRAAIFVYFVALGLGFILFELVLLQKLMVFLGGPAYSMSITLFSILLASGIGSFLSRNWSARPLRLLGIVIPLLVVVSILELLLLNHAVPRLMHLSHPMRAVIAVAMISPMGLLMGMPFPAGLRHVDSYRPELNPWAWGVNACATVIGAVLCALISSLLGLNITLLIGALVYLVGWIAFAFSQLPILSRKRPDLPLAG